MEITGVIESNQIYRTDLLDPRWLILNLYIHNGMEWNELEIIGIIESNQIYHTDLLDPRWLILNLHIHNGIEWNGMEIIGIIESNLSHWFVGSSVTNSELIHKFVIFVINLKVM